MVLIICQPVPLLRRAFIKHCTCCFSLQSSDCVGPEANDTPCFQNNVTAVTSILIESAENRMVFFRWNLLKVFNFPLLYHSKSADISSKCICYNVQCNPKLQERLNMYLLIPHFRKLERLHLFRCCFKSEISHSTNMKLTIACALLSSEVPVGHFWGHRVLSTF